MRNTNGLLISYERSVFYHYLAHSNYRISGYMLYMPTAFFTITYRLLYFSKYQITLREGIRMGVLSLYSLCALVNVLLVINELRFDCKIECSLLFV